MALYEHFTAALIGLIVISTLSLAHAMRRKRRSSRSLGLGRREVRGAYHLRPGKRRFGLRLLLLQMELVLPAISIVVALGALVYTWDMHLLETRAEALQTRIDAVTGDD